MATILKRGNTFIVGSDFVDAATAKRFMSHGTVTVRCERRESEFAWQSTASIETAERVIRNAAAADGFSVIRFISQAI